MGFFDKLKKGLNKTRENLTNKIEKIIIGYADIDDDLLDELEDGQQVFGPGDEGVELDEHGLQARHDVGHAVRAMRQEGVPQLDDAAPPALRVGGVDGHHDRGVPVLGQHRRRRCRHGRQTRAVLAAST